MLDKKAYRDSVLLPLQKNAAQQSAVADALRALNDVQDAEAAFKALARADAATLFALAPGMPDAELPKHFKSLEAFLNQGKVSAAKTLKQLLKATKGALGGHAFETAFWDALREATALIGKEELDAFAIAVKQDNPLAVVTAGQLRKAASSYGIGPGVGDRELAGAVGAQGVRVCPDFDVPAVDAGASSPKMRLHPSFRSVVDVLLVHERAARPDGIRVIDELSAVVAGGSRRAVGAADLRKSKAAVNTRSDDSTESAKKTLNAISEKCSTDAELRAFVLAWFVDLADQLVRRQGLTPTPALNRLTAVGLADLDARRLLVRAATGGAGPDLASVKAMIAAGDLAGARRVFTSLTGGEGAESQSPMAAQVAEALKAAEDRKSTAMDAYRRAVGANDFSGARAALADARAVDREDAEIARLLAQIPPDTPADLRADHCPGRGVRLSWRGARDPEVRYAVVRSESGAPANPKAGLQIAASTTDQEALDPDPPLARQAVYAVFAFRQGADYSAPAVTRTTVLPPPYDVDAVVTAKDATVFWHAPEQASGVSVDLVGANGSRKSFPATANGRLLIEGLRLGEKYTIILTAHYVVNGRPTSSEAVALDATPRGAARAVEDLRLGNTAMPDGKPGIRAEWTEVPGYTTDLWSLPIDAAVGPGERLTEDRLDALAGKRVVGAVRGGGPRQSMDFYAVRDVRSFVPLTWDGREGIAGRAVVAGTAPPPRDVEAVRLGSELNVSWVWPHGDYLMDVTWAADDGRRGGERVDRLAYRRDGGVRIPDAGLITEVSVGTVVVGRGEEHVFAPVTVRLEAVPPTMSYRLRLPRGLFGGREAQVSVTSEEFRGPVDLVAVMAPGAYMPARPGDGQEIARLHLDFSSGPTQSCAFRVPKAKGPYWVRLFAAPAAQIVLEDPSTSSMKG